MKLSPQITQINTDYKKIKKISVISVICGPLFSLSLGEARIMRNYHEDKRKGTGTKIVTAAYRDIPGLMQIDLT